MAQKISLGSFWGRLGTGVGEGLAEQMPKEMDRSRMKKDLKKFEDEASGLTPLQQTSRLASVYGMTPGMMQNFKDVIMQQNLSDAYRRAAEGDKGGGPVPSEQERREVDKLTSKQVRGEPGKMRDMGIPVPQERRIDRQAQPARGEMIRESTRPPETQAAGTQPPFQMQQQSTAQIQPGQEGERIVQRNALESGFLPQKPWSAQKKMQEILQFRKAGFTPQQSEALASEKEQRELTAPAAEQEQQTYLTDVQKQLRSAITAQLKKRGAYESITGDMLANLENIGEDMLRTDPTATVDKVGDQLAKLSLDFAKAKSGFNTLARTTGVESAFQGAKTLNKLEDYSEIFKKMGASEEYKDALISDMGLSSQGASKIAFPLSKNIKSFVNQFRLPDRTAPLAGDLDKHSRKAANEVIENITPDDSLQAIAFALRQKAGINEKSFFNELRRPENKEKLNDRQLRELAQGESNVTRSWGDFLVFPLMWGR